MFKKFDKLFIFAAFASFLFSVTLWFLVSHEFGLFVGIWVPSILSLWCGTRVSLLEKQLTSSKGGK